MPDDPRQFVHPATGCARCPALLTGRHHVVWGKGPIPAQIMAIGEAPGYNEDIEGIPFVGMAGKMMDRMLMQSGLRPAEINVRNMIMCRPPNNRDPEPDEIENCSPWLSHALQEVQPKVLLLFGRYALQLLFDRGVVAETLGLMQTQLCFSCGARAAQPHFAREVRNGLWQPIEQCLGKKSPLLAAAIYHPASVLGGRSPHNQEVIVHQLKRVRAYLDGGFDA